ncbi:DEAD/DEAH box helicase [Paucibacter soli]|uniref:DEAD/DEAH box helicase n=1 Tax=Paucibacter soli TaxID=3133433 RepID=UPI00309A82AF
MLLTIPRAYFDYTQPISRIDMRRDAGEKRYLVLRAGPTSLFDDGRNKTEYWQSARRVEIECVDNAGRAITLAAFGNVWPWKEVEEGMLIHVYGLVDVFRGALQLRNPHPVPRHARGRVIAQYSGKAGQVSGEALGIGIGRAIEYLDEAEVLLLAQAGLLDTEFTELTGVKSAQTLLRLLHFPRDVAQGERAMALARKLSAETVVRRSADARIRPPVASSAITINKKLVEELIADLPYRLTTDQRTAIDEIVRDLRSAYTMHRLLSGDVGTGKSPTFMVPAAAAYDAGAEVAILVPSQLLVKQMANDLRTMFPGLPVCEVVSGSKIGEGICVGTTALLHAAKKAKKKFNLVIVDEQHKFSVEQKSILTTKSTNVLEASATAIPRSLALVHFGGMDVSVLRECPVKKEIRTFIVTPDQRKKSDQLIADIVAKRGQVAVIYPLVDMTGESSVTEGLESVIGATKQWERRFPGRVGVLHGKLSPEEKNDVIAGMNAGKFDILVSSLVIEVGVTLPSLKAIVINHPERFGLAQLHQLRGRVARKGGTGFMLLLADNDLEEDAVERLQMLVKCNDGFKLAEADMDIRGFGDVNDDSASQTGSARTLFYNSKLSHQEIAKAAKDLGVVV